MSASRLRAGRLRRVRSQCGPPPPRPPKSTVFSDGPLQTAMVRIVADFQSETQTQRSGCVRNRAGVTREAASGRTTGRLDLARGRDRRDGEAQQIRCDGARHCQHQTRVGGPQRRRQARHCHVGRVQADAASRRLDHSTTALRQACCSPSSSSGSSVAEQVKSKIIVIKGNTAARRACQAHRQWTLRPVS